MKTKLKPYTVRDPEDDFAVLIFHFTAKQARHMGYHVLTGFSEDYQFIDIRAKWMKDSDFIYKEAVQELLEKNAPHSVDDPSCCQECETWGQELNENSRCPDCENQYYYITVK